MPEPSERGQPKWGPEEWAIDTSARSAPTYRPHLPPPPANVLPPSTPPAPLLPPPSTMTCLNHDGPSVASFRAGMELCFRRAVEEGLGVSLVPHLDDGGKWVGGAGGMEVCAWQARHGGGGGVGVG